MDDQRAALARWRAAGEAGDAAAAATALADDVVLISPLTDRFRFDGRARVQRLLEVALGAIGSITYTDEVVQDRTAALFYEARLGDLPFQEAQLLRCGEDGLIAEITLFLRPLPALTALARRLGPELARRDGRPVLARLLPVAAGVLHGVASSGERRIMPLAAPR